MNELDMRRKSSRRTLRGGLLALVLAGCAGRPSPPSANPMTLVEADTETVCSRTRDAGAFTQIVYRTNDWKKLAARADRDDPVAWDEIAELIGHNLRRLAHTACTEEMRRNVRASAARLRHAVRDEAPGW